jgi:beclin 1
MKFTSSQAQKDRQEEAKPSSKWFGEDGLVWDEDGELEKKDPDQLGESMSDEQLFRELLAHTIAEFELELPLCCECAQAYMNRILIQLEDTEKDILSMEAFLESFPSEDKLKQHFDDHDNSMVLLDREFDCLQKDFDRLLIRSAQQQQQIMRYDQRTEELRDLKEDFWHRYAQFRYEDTCQRDLHGTVKARLDHKTRHLEMLRTSCGLNDFFSISFQGHFATINGLRLGLKSPSLKSTVDWDEISAAFGYLAFLVVKIGTALGHIWTQARFRVRVDGSFSTVIEHNQKGSSAGGSVLNLHLDKESSWTLLRFRDLSSFDRGFEGFLRSIIDISSLISARDSEFMLPYPLTSDPLTIGGSPLASSRANPEAWTHLAKQLSIDIKTILQWMVSAGIVR